MAANPFHVFELEETLSPAESLARIERVCLSLIQNGYVEYSTPDRANRLCVDGVLRLGIVPRLIRMENPSLLKALAVLRMCHNALLENKTLTLREIYYRNKHQGGGGGVGAWAEDKFKDELQSQRAIVLCMYLTGITRASLGIRSSQGKGFVAGLNPDALEFVHPIPTFASVQDLQPIFHRLATSPRRPMFLLLVEKHTVLHRLVQTDFLLRCPSVVVTGKGYPDLETRKFARACRDSLGLIPIGLCDMNPHGMAIMGTYAWGSLRLAGETHRYVLPNLFILGLTAEDGREYEQLCVQNGQETQFQAFTQADVACLQTLVQAGQIMGNVHLMQELQEGFLSVDQRKLELDAFEQVAPGYLFEVLLPRKLQALIDEAAMAE